MQNLFSRHAVWGLMLVLAPLAVAAAAAPALADQLTATRAALGQVSFDAAIYVERTASENGTPIHALEPAKHLSSGERVVTLVNWSRPAGNSGGKGGFTLVNALPAALHYQRSSQDNEEVSVDGGHSWGHLGSLKIGPRLATAADVTHLRWHVSSEEAAAGSGQIAYAGFVR